MAKRRRSYLNSFWHTKVRPAILARDGYRCRIRGQGCTGEATEVDHIVPPAKGGAVYDPTNLRAACKPCNSSKSDRPGPSVVEASRAW